MASFLITGTVSESDIRPYVQISNKAGVPIAQMEIHEARQIAADIMCMAARAEADALLLRFARSAELPAALGLALMERFRALRKEVDVEARGPGRG